MSNVTIPVLHNAQEQVIRESKRFNVVCTGRRWGKMVLGRELLFRLAAQGYRVGWFSFSRKMLDSTWDDLAINPATGDRAENRIKFLTGGAVEMWNTRAKTHLPFGRNYAAVVIDEAALVPNLEQVWSEVICPTLDALKGTAWFLSTPSVSLYFKELYSRGQDPYYPDWASWQFPTSTNPHIVPEDLAEASRYMSRKAFNQEYKAEFVGASA